MATRPQKRKSNRAVAAQRATAARLTKSSRGAVLRGAARHSASKHSAAKHPGAKRPASKRAAAKHGAAPKAVRPARRVAAFLAQHAKDAPFVPQGLRAFWEYRDLGIAEATGGRYGGFIVRSNHAGTESTGIHFHKPDVQLIYILKGWLKADYRGQGTVTLEAGTMLHNPPGNPHNVFAYSEDLEFLEITAPADYPTVDVESVEGPIRTRRSHG